MSYTPIPRKRASVFIVLYNELHAMSIWHPDVGLPMNTTARLKGKPHELI